MRSRFKFTMTGRTHILLVGWLLMHVVWMPIISSELMRRFPDALGVLEYNVLFYTVSFAAVLFIAWHYLRTEFDTLLDNGFLTIITLFRAFFLNFGLSFLASFVLMTITGGSTEWLTTPNDEAVMSLSAQDSYKMMAMTVFLAPVIEEVLFRGAIFGALLTRDRLVAYIVSVIIFSVAHVWQYALQSWDITVLLYIISYLPAAYVLAWCYEKTGSIWTGILFHMGNNLYGMSVLF